MISVLLHKAKVITPLSTEGGGYTRVGSASDHNRLLLCAPSNAAVDEIVMRLSAGVWSRAGNKRRVNVVRLGTPMEGCSEEVMKATLDHQADVLLKRETAWRHYMAVNDRIDKARNELMAMKSAALTGGPSSNIARMNELRNALADHRRSKHNAELMLDRARYDIRKGLLQAAEVVIGTLSSSGQQQLVDHILQYEVGFETAIIDEAAQTTEPSTLIPLRYGCRRLVLVGDPRQLPATVLSQKAEAAGLGVSLFERCDVRYDQTLVVVCG